MNTATRERVHDLLIFFLLSSVFVGVLSCASSHNGDNFADDDYDDDTIDNNADDDQTADDDTDYLLFGVYSHEVAYGDPYHGGYYWVWYWDVYELDSRAMSWSFMTTIIDQDGASNGIWGFGEENILICGGEGIIKHYDGQEWKRMASGTKAELGAIWSNGLNDVYIVGTLHPEAEAHPGHVILHYDGTSWKIVRTGPDRPLYGLDGTGADNVFAVGSGFVLHFDGQQWSEVEVDSAWNLRNVWASMDGGAFAVGVDQNERPLMVHFDGIAWSVVPMEWPADLYSLSDVWGTGPDNIYVVGIANGLSNGTMVFHFDGESWSLTAQLNIYGYRLWGFNERNIFSAGRGTSHFDGKNWIDLEHSPEFDDFHGAARR